MEIATLWLLLAVSQGTYNRGAVVVVGSFPTANDCWKVVEKVKVQKGFDAAAFTCTEAKVVWPS